MTLETIVAMDASNSSNTGATSCQRRQGSIKSATALINALRPITIQDIIAGATCMTVNTMKLILMMKGSKVLKEKSPGVQTGQFETYAKIGFAIPGYISNPRIAQPRSFFQLSSSLKSILNGVLCG